MERDLLSAAQQAANRRAIEGALLGIVAFRAGDGEGPAFAFAPRRSFFDEAHGFLEELPRLVDEALGA